MATTTRQTILQTLSRRQQCTIKELAEVAEINPISVRHHITRLEAEGLVTSKEERHGVGRPRRVYMLTKAGLERFPSRYVDMTVRLLEQIKQNLPAPVVERLFTQMAQDLADEQAVQLDLEGLSVEERLDVVKQVLNEEGFDVYWEQKGNAYYIHEATCPYLHIGEAHPEICSMDRTLISTLLRVPAEQIHCRLDGDDRCTYTIPKDNIPVT